MCVHTERELSFLEVPGVGQLLEIPLREVLRDDHLNNCERVPAHEVLRGDNLRNCERVPLKVVSSQMNGGSRVVSIDRVCFGTAVLGILF